MTFLDVFPLMHVIVIDFFGFAVEAADGFEFGVRGGCAVPGGGVATGGGPGGGDTCGGPKGFGVVGVGATSV